MKQKSHQNTTGQEIRRSRNRASGRGGVAGTLCLLHGSGWVVLEWKCAIKDLKVGARQRSEFIRTHVIEATKRSFADFAARGNDQAANRAMLGLPA